VIAAPRTSARSSWWLMPDGRAARIEPCEADPERPHLIFMDEEVTDRHRYDIENQSEPWDGGTACYECPAEIGGPHTAGCPIAICLVTGEQWMNCEQARIRR
jgi:hypothetical protein